MENRTISDLQNDFTEIESVVQDGELVCLTKDGFPSMIVMSVERYKELLGERQGTIEAVKTEGKSSVLGHSHDEIFFRT